MRRVKLAPPDRPADDKGACLACKLPLAERKVHWFYSFTSPVELFAHIAKEGIATTEEYRRKLARWYADCEDRVHQSECDPKRWTAKTENVRRWSLLAREAKTPDAMDTLAAELLSDGAQRAVKFWTDMWRKNPQGMRLTRSEQDEIAARTLGA